MFTMVSDGSSSGLAYESSHPQTAGGWFSGGSPTDGPRLEPERKREPLDFPRRVLLVEPAERERLRLRNELIAGQMEVVEANDLIAALRSAPILKPNLILAQMRLPSESGLELVRRVQEDCKMHAIPVILYSNFATAAERVLAFDLGAADLLSQPFEGGELIARMRAVLKTRHKLTMLERQAYRDGLTGLANRSVFEDQLVRDWDACRRHNVPLTAIVADLDHFKAINDTHGHAAGDEVLRQAAKMLAQSARSSDLVARYGGEEFVIIAPDCPLEAGVALADRFRSLLTERTISVEGVPISVTASVGIATGAFEAQDSPMELFRRADRALYQAKRSGRDAIWVYDHAQAGPTEAVVSGTTAESSS
jgi:diguanylate cyclase (GGDEF)-like protein